MYYKLKELIKNGTPIKRFYIHRVTHNRLKKDLKLTILLNELNKPTTMPNIIDLLYESFTKDSKTNLELVKIYITFEIKKKITKLEESIKTQSLDCINAHTNITIKALRGVLNDIKKI